MGVTGSWVTQGQLPEPPGGGYWSPFPIYEAYPLAPERTRVGMTLCFPAGTAERPDFEARAQRYYDRFDTALAEDVPMLERQQAGLTSPFARQGRFSYLEPSVAAFAFWYAGRLLES